MWEKKQMELLLVFGTVYILPQLIFCYDIPKNIKFQGNYTYEPDIYRNVSELIVSKGYPLEEHTIETSDGYLLSVQRIPDGRKQLYSQKSKPVVLMQHGLLSAGSDWVLNFPHQSLGFILADLGYDVWIANSRGNYYSRRHKTLKPNEYAFWNFSFQEMAEKDLPAMMNYMLNKTEQKQLFYVGHSQGTTVLFALLSEYPEWNEKIKLFIALGPVATVGYITNAIKYLSPLAIDFDWFLKLVGYNEFLPTSELMKYLSDKVCESEAKPICDEMLKLIYGWEPKQMNETRLPVYLSHYPSGTSTKSIVHFAQMVESKKFQKYDYGKHNMDHYNQDTPPEYNVTKITTPTALFWATADSLADFIDVSLLERRLKCLVLSYCVPNRDFIHGEFVYGIHAPELVYDEVISLMQKYR